MGVVSKLTHSGQRRILVLIVTFNGVRFIPNFLASLGRAAQKTALELCAVDNASTDDVLLELAKNTVCPTHIIRNTNNLGFAAANNQGFAYAITHQFDAVFVVNYDTKLTPGLIDRLVSRLDTQEPRIIQPLVLLGDSGRLNTSGNGIHYLGVGYCQDMGRPLAELAELNFHEIPTATGAGMLIDTRIIKKIGGFEASLFMYGEDSEFSWRARAVGYTVWLEPAAILHHYFEAKRNPQKYYFLERNRYAFLIRHYDARALAVLALPLFAFELVIIIKAAREGWLAKKLLADAAVFGLLPSFVRTRWTAHPGPRAFRRLKPWLSAQIIDPEHPRESYQSWYNRFSCWTWQWLRPLV